MRQKMKQLMGILLSISLMLGLVPGMSLTAWATNAVNVKITSKSSSSSTIWTRASSTTIPENDSVRWLVPQLNWDNITVTEITITGSNAYDYNTRPGREKVIRITDVGTFSIVVTYKYDTTAQPKTETFNISVEEVFPHNVTITPGSNMTKTTNSGDETQTGVTAAMKDVVYTANDGYYFPRDYSVDAVNGIRVTRNSYTQITVSGTPTDDASITLKAPTAKTTPDAPTTAAAVNCTTSANNDGKLTGVTPKMEYKKSDATDWTSGRLFIITGLVPGTYYVRFKATDTTYASGNQELTVAPTYEVTYKVVNGTWSDGSTTDKTETVQSGLKPASVPTGMKASSGYTGGAWDTDPAEATITGAKTFTYTFTAKQAATVTKAPKAKTLTYNGQAQELVTAGEATGGTMQYTLGTASEATGSYSASIPTATNAGTYYVWYKVVGDANHNDTEPKCVTVNTAQNESESEAEKQDPIPSGGGGGSIPQATTPVTIPAETVEEPTKEELQVPASIFLNSGFLVSWSGSKVRVSWGSVPEADSYEIYANYCGNKSCVRVASVSGRTSTTLKKLNGKKIKTKKFVKAYVIAYKNGAAIGRTILGHAAGPKSAYTNAKAVTVDQSAYQLKAGETAKVSATITKAKRNKKLPGINHGAKLRYASTNEGVATVDGNGVITAVGSGTCEVWIYALNGRSAKVTVNVN